MSELLFFENRCHDLERLCDELLKACKALYNDPHSTKGATLAKAAIEKAEKRKPNQ